MAINQTIINSLSTIEQGVLMCSKEISSPYLVFFYVAYLIIFLVVGLIVTEGGSKKFFALYAATSVILLAILVFIYVNPLQTYDIFTRFFS